MFVKKCSQNYLANSLCHVSHLHCHVSFRLQKKISFQEIRKQFYALGVFGEGSLVNVYFVEHDHNGPNYLRWHPVDRLKPVVQLFLGTLASFS